MPIVSKKNIDNEISFDKIIITSMRGKLTHVRFETLFLWFELESRSVLLGTINLS